MIIRWHQNNLIDHYNRHPGGRDRECWADLTSLPAPIPVEMYEGASFEAWANPMVEIKYLSHRQSGNSEQCVSRIDDRGIRVIARVGDGWVKGCLHLHDHTTRHQPSLLPAEVVEVLRDKLTRAVAAQRESEHDPPIESLRWRP